MKVYIYGGEAFPVYEVSASDENDKYNIEVDAETLKRWRAAFENFSLVQDEIVAQLEKQGKGNQVWAGGTWTGFNLEEEL